MTSSSSSSSSLSSSSSSAHEVLISSVSCSHDSDMDDPEIDDHVMDLDSAVAQPSSFGSYHGSSSSSSSSASTSISISRDSILFSTEPFDSHSMQLQSESSHEKNVDKAVFSSAAAIANGSIRIRKNDKSNKVGQSLFIFDASDCVPNTISLTKFPVIHSRKFWTSTFDGLVGSNELVLLQPGPRGFGKWLSGAVVNWALRCFINKQDFFL